VEEDGKIFCFLNKSGNSFKVVVGYDTLGMVREYQIWGRTYAENSAFLGRYAASSRNFFPTFRDNLSVPFSGFKNPKESLWPGTEFV